MKDECLELLTKIDKCIKDEDFQLILIMKFLRSFAPYLKAFTIEDEKDERNSK